MSGDDDKDHRFQALYQIGMGVHYHMRRQQFFESWHRLTGVLSIVFSTSAVASFVNASSDGSWNWAVFFAVVVAISQSIDLVIDTRGKGFLHNDLRREYVRVSHDLLDIVGKVSETEFNQLSKKIRNIEINEPPIKKLLLEVVHNDVGRKLNIDKEELHKISWLKRSTANLINWNSSIS